MGLSSNFNLCRLGIDPKAMGNRDTLLRAMARKRRDDIRLMSSGIDVSSFLLRSRISSCDRDRILLVSNR